MKLFLSVLFISIFSSISYTAYASEVVVTVAFEAQEAVTDELVAGTMTAQVVNLGGDTINNVNLRPDSVGSLAFSREVLQFGSVSSGEAGVVHLSFHADQAFFDDPTPTSWRLDYDLAGGAHQQSIVTAD